MSRECDWERVGWPGSGVWRNLGKRQTFKCVERCQSNASHVAQLGVRPLPSFCRSRGLNACAAVTCNTPAATAARRLFDIGSSNRPLRWGQQRQRRQSSSCPFVCNHAITPLNKMRERAMSLSQIAGDAEASQVIKGESQDIKAELDPSYVNVKVKQQVRYFLVTF